MVKVLLADNDTEWIDTATEYLGNNDVSTQVASSSELCEKYMEKQQFSALVLNLKKNEREGFDILKTLKTVSPSTKIIISLNNKNQIHNEPDIKHELKRLGVSRFLVKPYSMMTLEEEIKSFTFFEDWTSIQHAIETGKHDLAIKEADTKFNPIPISIFHNNHVFIIDVYIKLGTDKYLKILHAGESMEKNRIEKFENVKNIQTLYFKSEEKSLYIEFANNIISELEIKTQETPSEVEDIALAIQQNISEANNERKPTQINSTLFEFDNPLSKFLSGPDLNGIQQEIIEQSSLFCQESYSMIRKVSKLETLYYSLINANPEEQKHSFLTSVLSSACCLNLEAHGNTDIETVTIAAMLHDIGKTQFTKDIKKVKFKNMDEYEIKQFYKHGEHASEILEEFDFINDQVRLIISQHHERVNGKGFPKGLTAKEILPLAQIVGLADELARTAIEYNMTTKEAFKFRLLEPLFLEAFSPEILKAMSQIFIKDKKRSKKKKKTIKLQGVKVKKQGIY